MKKDAANRKKSAGVTSGSCHSSPPPPAPAGVCNSDGVCVDFYTGQADLADALKAAAAADVVLVFMATTSHEGSDRSDLSLGDMDSVGFNVSAVAGAKTAVIAVTPGPVLTPWRAGVASVITPMMPGQQYGAAIADVLFGAVNPSGKLLVTFPDTENEMNLSTSQWPGIETSAGQVAFYGERLNVGYRWYASHPEVKPAYAFGHGETFDLLHPLTPHTPLAHWSAFTF